MTRKELLAALPADFKITVGDKEIDAAAFRNEIDTEFDTTAAGIADRDTQLAQAHAERDAAIAAANLRTAEKTNDKPVDARQALLDAMKGIVSEKDEYDFNDPYSSQLLKRIGKMIGDQTNGISTAQQGALDELKQGVMGIAAMALMQQMNSDFARHKWPDGYDAAKAWSEALHQGYVNPQTKLPDIARFNRDVMAPLELKGAEKAARDEGIAEGRRLAAEEAKQRNVIRGRFNMVPKPGGGSAAGDKKGAATQGPRNLGEAIDAIEISPADIQANMGLKVGG